MRPQGEIVEAIRKLLDQCLGERAEAAFVYGSVAGGAATSDSDIDTFVIARGEVPTQVVSELAAEASKLQIGLGFQPDLEHPIEIFPVEACVNALHEVLTLRALTTAARGDVLDPMTLNSDCLEILRALLNQRVVVIDSPILDSLTRLAMGRLNRAARNHGVNGRDLSARIGVKWAGSSCAQRP